MSLTTTINLQLSRIPDYVACSSFVPRRTKTMTVASRGLASQMPSIFSATKGVIGLRYPDQLKPLRVLKQALPNPLQEVDQYLQQERAVHGDS